MLQQIDLGPGSVALHSLNLPLHQYKRWAEADFIVLCPAGILLLEVKGGKVSCRNGIWEFQDRTGKVTTKNESPAVQAKTAFYALRDNYLFPRFEDKLKRVPMGWGVVFKDVPRLVHDTRSQLPDQPDEITGYKDVCSGHNNFAAYLRRVLEHWAGRLRSAPVFLPPSVLGEIAATLRPNFEQVPPLATRVEEFGQDLAALTQEQYERLDEIQENERILVRGGAGTGKTFLAMACARYDAAAGLDVLFTTRSHYLVQYLCAGEVPAGVSIVPFDNLPHVFAARGARWQSLVVDEGQDLCQAETIDLLDSVIERGMEKGRWRWFGDPNRQVSATHPLDPDVLEYLEGLGTKCRLRQNVRNAPEILQAIARFVGADAGSPAPRGQGSEVVFHECPRGNEAAATALVIKGWMRGDGGAQRSDIAVLVPSRKDIAPVAAALSQAGIRAEPLEARPNGKRRDTVVVAAVEDFKGLERPLVCLAGVGEGGDEEVRGQLYRAFSRANHTLAAVCCRRDGEALARLAARIAMEGIGN